MHAALKVEAVIPSASMRPLRTLAIVVFLACVAAACTINGSRSLGDDCLQNRECAEGLSCQPRSDGRFVCQPIVEAGPLGVDASADASDGSSDAAPDAGATE
jgi:hypothetical protein